MSSDLGQLTQRLHVDGLQDGADLHGLPHAHVAGDARSPGSIVDGDQALPLLHGQGGAAGDIQPLVLYLACAASGAFLSGKAGSNTILLTQWQLARVVQRRADCRQTASSMS